MEIPSEVLQSARMSVAEIKQELALSLYALGRLSMGKAAELADIPVGRFQLLLGSREMGIHYGLEEALEDSRILANRQS